MQNFLLKHAAVVIGVLSGFDRVVFRGSLRNIAYAAGMSSYLALRHILLKDATAHFKAVSEELKEKTKEQAEALHRPIVYLRSSRQSKEEEARSLAQRDGIKEGFIGVLIGSRVAKERATAKNAR